jgi:hypothetical protein
MVMVQLQLLSMPTSIECKNSEFAEAHSRWLS